MANGTFHLRALYTLYTLALPSTPAVKLCSGCSNVFSAIGSCTYRYKHAHTPINTHTHMHTHIHTNLHINMQANTAPNSWQDLREGVRYLNAVDLAKPALLSAAVVPQRAVRERV